MTNASRTVGVAGLGQMGRGMAGRLLAAGFPLTVYNRSTDKAEELASQGAKVAVRPTDLGGCQVVVSMVLDDAALREVTLGQDGFLAALEPGSVHVSCSTVSPNVIRELAEAHETCEVGFVAAPVFGRPDVAARGELNAVVAGTSAAISVAQPVIEAFSKAVFEVGTQPEQAVIIKLAGNFLIHVLVESLGEAMSLAERWDVAPDTLLHVLTSTIFPAPLYQQYGDLIGNRKFDPAFPIRSAQKDLRLALAAANEQDLTLPFGEVLRSTFQIALERGLGDQDLSALSEVVRQGADRP